MSQHPVGSGVSTEQPRRTGRGHPGNAARHYNNGNLSVRTRTATSCELPEGHLREDRASGPPVFIARRKSAIIDVHRPYTNP